MVYMFTLSILMIRATLNMLKYNPKNMPDVFVAYWIGKIVMVVPVGFSEVRGTMLEKNS